MLSSPRPRDRFSYALVLATAVVLASCSTDDAPNWSLDNIEVGEGQFREINTFLRSASVSPDGSLLAFGGNGEICVQAIDERSAECAEVDTSIDELSITWSDDATTLYFTASYTRFFDDTDIVEVDTATLDLDVRTDDRVDGRLLDETDDDALIDLTPFVGPDGAVHFFRSRFEQGRDDDFELFRLDDDGRNADDAEQVGSLDLPRGVFPTGSTRKIDDERWIVEAFDPDEFGRTIFVIDFANDEIVEVDTDLEQAVIADVTTDMVLVAEPNNRGDPDARYSLIDLESGRDRIVEPDLEDGFLVSGAGFSPDGSSIAFAVTAPGGMPEVIALPIEDGRALEDEVETLVSSRDFDDLEIDGVVSISGFGFGNEISWTAERLLLISQRSSHLISFEIAPA